MPRKTQNLLLVCIYNVIRLKRLIKWFVFFVDRKIEKYFRNRKKEVSIRNYFAYVLGNLNSVNDRQTFGMMHLLLL